MLCRLEPVSLLPAVSMFMWLIPFLLGLYVPVDHYAGDEARLWRCRSHPGSLQSRHQAGKFWFSFFRLDPPLSRTPLP